jgi:rhodanese-related sulfurtransferase
VEIVAYCRGPFCLMSDEAVKLLQARGFRARKTFDGVSEWQAAGLPVSSAGQPRNRHGVRADNALVFYESA